MNTLLENMKSATNYTMTENGGIAHKSTKSKLLDMFAMGAAMRNRPDEDVILMFKNAYEENPEYALKCLFWIRDARGGAGERRFFRVVLHWLADYDKDAVIRNLDNISEFGRWDDLYALVGTSCENEMFAAMKHQLAIDIQSETPSLLAKWMKSINTSSKESRRLGEKTRQYLGMTNKEYRKTLSVLRTRINIVEKLMSENRWNDIRFDAIPSKAGLKYKNAFARRDIIKAKYEKFAKDKNTTVNAGALYPYEVVKKAIECMDSENPWGRSKIPLDDVDRLMINKYWDNLTDYFNGASLNALCMIDTSGSMSGTPINVATSLGLYCAERNKGPFHNHYISFSSRPQLIETEGVDFCDKVDRIVKTDLCENTNIEAAFDMVLNTALDNHLPQSDLPEYMIIISDMEFDCASGWRSHINSKNIETTMDIIAKKYKVYGYEIPKIIYWNVDARQNNIPSIAGNVSYVSGFSPSIFQTIMSGKTGYELMMETLNQDRYSVIH